MKILDVRGQLCPMPVIKTQAMVQSMSKGEQLEVICTDPGVKQDIPMWCEIHGHKVMYLQEEQGTIRVGLEVV